MKATRVYNNNAVATLLENNQEAILIGSGIGFNTKCGDEIDQSKIEKIFGVHDAFQSKFLSLVEEVKPEMIVAAEEILFLAQHGEEGMTSQGILSLLDHIQFAIERVKQDIFLPNLMLAEIKLLYPSEFQLGVSSLAIIKEHCFIDLPEDEAGYIALHFVNATNCQKDTYNSLKFVKGTLQIIHETYGIDVDQKRFDVMRFITHLKLLAHRIFIGEDAQRQPVLTMYDYLIDLNELHKPFLQTFKCYVKTTFDYEICRQEEVYLLIHLTKIL